MIYIGLDPSKAATGLAAVDWHDGHPRLRVLRVVGGDSLAARSTAASSAWSAVADIARLEQLDLAVAVELNFAGPGVMAHDDIVGSAYLTLSQAWNAEIDLRAPERFPADDPRAVLVDGVYVVATAQWSKRLGLPRSKRGDGLHRIAEAERLVECPADTFRGLGRSVVDAAEAVLVAAALAYHAQGVELVDTAPPKGRARRGA
jgi:hypothetical protein